MREFLLMLVAAVLLLLLAVPVVVGRCVWLMVAGQPRGAAPTGELLRGYFMQVAIGLDQAGGSMLYGTEDYTVSTWSWELANQGNRAASWLVVVIDSLFGTGHCLRSWQNEISYAQQEKEELRQLLEKHRRLEEQHAHATD